MADYLNWSEKILNDPSTEAVEKAYDEGFVFTRIGKGVMQQTRSLRINIDRFVLTSENRRILKKVEDIKTGTMTPKALSIPYKDYNFKMGKLAKDFYEAKFGSGIMSAQKIKEMLTNAEKSNFNLLLTYLTKPRKCDGKDLSDSSALGFAICYSNANILHYSYPFYDLTKAPKDMGLAMMIMAVQYAKENGLKYIYLGSLQRSSDTYKLQFKGLEWFNGKAWQTDLEEAKKILKSVNE